MKKIISLSGSSTGMNSFRDVAKGLGIWMWNINHRNVASKATRFLEWDGERNEVFYSFLDLLVQAANETFDFEVAYTKKMIEKFMVDKKATMLIIYNMSDDALVRFNDICNVHIVDPDNSDGTHFADHYLIYEDDEKFIQCAKELLAGFLEE